VWALAALGGSVLTELPTPALFESALQPISEDAVAEAVVCGPDVRRYVDRIRAAEEAGYTHVCLHQVGPEQEAFMEFCEREVLPAFARRSESRRERRAGPGVRRTPARAAKRARRS